MTTLATEDMLHGGACELFTLVKFVQRYSTGPKLSPKDAEGLKRLGFRNGMLTDFILDVVLTVDRYPNLDREVFDQACRATAQQIKQTERFKTAQAAKQEESFLKALQGASGSPFNPHTKH